MNNQRKAGRRPQSKCGMQTSPQNGRGIQSGRPRKESGGSVRAGRELAEIKKEKRQLAEYRREAEWQSEVERVHGGVDKIMLAIIMLLLTFGAVMVYSASYPTAQLEADGDGLFYLKKHLIFMAIGAVLMFAASAVPYRLYKSWGPFAAYGVAILLLLAVLVIGTSEGEAKRWIYIGSFSIQPSEIMKVALVLMLAWYIDKYQGKMKERISRFNTFKYNTFYPLLLIGIACGLVLLEKHLSGTAIIGLIGISVMLVGGCHMGYTLGTSLIGGAAAATVFIIMNPYALKRLTTFTSENVDKLKEGWQTTQGIYAIGSGGLFGVGFSESRQKFSYVSKAHNDFIFTIWCEELGFIGAVLLIGLFIAFIWRGYVVAMRAPDTFSMLTVFGITTQVGLQAFLNMMVVCDIIPNTGISLPFFSYGGSSLVMLMAEMGIILSISRQYYRKKIL
ncbi:MAG: cell division protein FtsW [Clostridiales bacterium]|nr:cell division protein FtsW [Clostridiales bacterium]